MIGELTLRTGLFTLSLIAIIRENVADTERHPSIRLMVAGPIYFHVKSAENGK